MKFCKFCGETKDESLFHKDNRLKSGRSNICKACHNKREHKRMMKRRKEDPIVGDEFIKYQTSWFKKKCDNNPDFCLKRNEYQREYYKTKRAEKQKNI